MTLAYGVITTDEGAFVRFVTSEPEALALSGVATELPPPVYGGDYFHRSLGDPGMFGDGALYHDPDCPTDGCWCANARAAGMDTFHCAECIQPYDRDYECSLYPRLCLGCCGHTHCQVLWDNLLQRLP